MAYSDLREFLSILEKKGELLRFKAEIDPRLEITEVLSRLLQKKGPAVIFENVRGHSIPVVAKLFGTVDRIAQGLNTDEEGLKKIGEFLAFLQHPEPPKGLVDAVKKLPFYRQMFNLTPKKVKKAPCQEVVLQGDDINLSKFPILTCWPDDAGPQITWSLVITQGPNEGPPNVGIYRMQILHKEIVLRIPIAPS